MNNNNIIYIIYKTTNLINNKIYIGQHQTYNINDSYIGSGTHLLLAIKKYGKLNFKREILFSFNTFDEMNNKEIEIVNEDFIKLNNTYNKVLGGKGNMSGFVPVKDSYGNTSQVSINDPRYISGELKMITIDMAVVKDSYGNTSQVSINDPRYISGELKGVNDGFVPVKDSYGNTSQVSINDPRYISGELYRTNSKPFNTPYGIFNNGKEFVNYCKTEFNIEFNITLVNYFIKNSDNIIKNSKILSTLNYTKFKGKTPRELGFFLL